MLIENQNENTKVELTEFNSEHMEEETNDDSDILKYPRVGFFKLQYTFCDKADIVLMGLAFLGSIAAGASMPLVSLLLGKVINQFDGTIALSEVPKLTQGIILNFIYAGLGVFSGSLMMIFFWTIIGKRISNKICKEYFRVIMKQKQAWFDKYDTFQINTRVFNNMQVIENGVTFILNLFIS